MQKQNQNLNNLHPSTHIFYNQKHHIADLLPMESKQENQQHGERGQKSQYQYQGGEKDHWVRENKEGKLQGTIQRNEPNNQNLMHKTQNQASKSNDKIAKQKSVHPQEVQNVSSVALKKENAQDIEINYWQENLDQFYEHQTQSGEKLKHSGGSNKQTNKKQVLDDEKWERMAMKDHKQVKVQSSLKEKLKNLETKNVKIPSGDTSLFSPMSPPRNAAILESDCFMEINGKKWEKVSLKLTKYKLNVGAVCMDLQKILKVKIFPTEIVEEKSKAKNSTQVPKSQEATKVMKKNILKITVEDNNSFQFYQVFPSLVLPQPRSAYSPSIMPQAQTGNGEFVLFPLPYLTLSKLILKKIKQLYPNTKATEWDQPQFMPRAIIHQNQSLTSKKNTRNYVFIHGTIYKKSQHKGNWQKRYIILNENGIYSYKGEKDEIYSFFIQAQDIKYMWTWFTCLKVDKQKDKNKYNEVEDIENVLKDFITNEINKNNKTNQSDANENLQNKNSYLIIKIKHGFNGQTEFGIPICGFDNLMNKVKNWLYAFYKVLSKDQN